MVLRAPYHKLLAYKDEYEVARLYTDGRFRKQIARYLRRQGIRCNYSLAPPLLAARDGDSGHLKKRLYGAMDDERLPRPGKIKIPARHVNSIIFGYSAERRDERQMIESL